MTGLEYRAAALTADHLRRIARIAPALTPSERDEIVALLRVRPAA